MYSKCQRCFTILLHCICNNLNQVSIFCFSIFMIFIRIVESVYHYAAVFCCSSFGCTQQVTFTTLFSAFVLHLLFFDDQHFSFFQIFQIGFPYPFVIKLLSADINIRFQMLLACLVSALFSLLLLSEENFHKLHSAVFLIKLFSLSCFQDTCHKVVFFCGFCRLNSFTMPFLVLHVKLDTKNALHKMASSDILHKVTFSRLCQREPLVAV